MLHVLRPVQLLDVLNVQILIYTDDDVGKVVFDERSRIEYVGDVTS
jgi:hypothetical protein